MRDHAQPDQDKVLALLLQTLEVMENARQTENSETLSAKVNISTMMDRLIIQIETMKAEREAVRTREALQKDASQARLDQLRERSEDTEKSIIDEIELRSELLMAIRQKVSGQERI